MTEHEDSPQVEDSSEIDFPADEEIISHVRDRSGVRADLGPSNAAIVAAVKAVALTFEFWYSRVMKEAVDKYRKLIIGRINPYIRRMQLEGSNPEQVAETLVQDYDSRNFVTAGGWVLEALAVNVGVNARKSLIEGVDLERQEIGALHLCVLKSGTVTRNSDILKMLKTNVRKAERLHGQIKTNKEVIVGDYVQMTGNTSPTHIEDGIRRPSSAQFWSELTGLPSEEALELTLEIVAEASQIASPDASSHVSALKSLVAEYIRNPEDPSEVDWEFLAKRNMSEEKQSWIEEDKNRDAAARAAVIDSGYEIYRKK